MTLPLKLLFVKGPRDGESFEYKPGSTITIGRVVRGNKISVKDAGISTKHLRIVSDSDNWIIQDLGSSNGTIVNSESLEPHISVNLSHRDVIKLGEVTSIIVNFETNDHAEEPKLPPRPGRNTRRLPVAVPDPVPIEDKPTRKGRARKNEKKVAITKEEEEVPVEKMGNNSRARGGNKNTEATQNSGLNSIKLEIEDTPKGVESSRVTRSKQIGKDTSLEEMRRHSRATRSMKKEIVGDSLEMVLSQARKSRANNKKMEQKQPSRNDVEEMETKNDDVEEEDKENENDVEAQKDGSKTSERVEQVETESRNVIGEDEETENLQDAVDEETDFKSEEAGVETSDGGCDDEEKTQQESRNDKKAYKIDLEKMTLGEWIEHMKVQIPKQIIDETEKIIDEMRSRSRRVHQYIAEQQAKGKGSTS